MSFATRVMRVGGLALGAALVASPALAGAVIVVPEPESLAMLAAALAIGVVALRFGRRR